MSEQIGLSLSLSLITEEAAGKMLSLFVILASLHLSFALFGGLSMSSGEKTMHLRKLGFDEDPRTFSHELVVPWVRPFKPGYCSSWEWHTDAKYRDSRIKVCKELSGGESSSFSGQMSLVPA